LSWVLDRDLGDVEARLTACAREWRLRLGAALAGGHRSSVVECWTPAGVEAVVKLTPTWREAELEARALTAWRDTGAAVRLLDANPAAGALLLRRVRPGTHLPPGDEGLALAVAADLLPRLHSVPADPSFPTLDDLYPFLARHSLEDVDYERRSRGEPQRAAAAVALLAEANAAAASLCDTADARVLLHGDFLDKNLLLDGVRYVSSDPIPRVGDPASDVGFFAHDHQPASGILERARAIATATDNDPWRSQRWAAVWTVLLAVSAWRDDQEDLERLVWTRPFLELLDP
jgi:streptomycin 6-kinase